MEDYNDISSDNSYNEEACYSDQIDSDIETELYGLVHHDTSISFQDKSNSVESNNISLQDKPKFVESNSILQQNSLNPSADFSILVIPTNSDTVEETANLTKKLKNTIKKSTQNYNSPFKNNHSDFFCSDAVINSNLYTNFESPVRKQEIQNNQVQSKISKRNISEVCTKRKSDVISEILGNIQLKKKRNSKLMETENGTFIQNKKSHNHNSVISTADSYCEVIDDSSDSDSSILFLEPDQSNLQTNMANETVVLSSDSEDSDSSMEIFLSQSCQKKKTKASNLDSNHKDLWHINLVDKLRSNKHSNRYHENASLTCSKCELKGHSAKFCSDIKAKKCLACGGYHLVKDCKNKICSNCFQLGHVVKNCYSHYACELCQMRGHSKRNCPDLWRRYHLTTSEGGIVKGNPNPHSPLYCFNCGLRGHYGAKCTVKRKNSSTWTTVISYENPIGTYQKERERNFHKRSKFDNTPLSYRRKRNEAFSKDTPLQNTKRKKKKKSPKTPTSENYQYPTRPKNTVQNEIYFPRTPKTSNSVTPTSSTLHYKKKKFKQLNKGNLLQQQVMHRIGLHQRLGLPLPSSI